MSISLANSGVPWVRTRSRLPSSGASTANRSQTGTPINALAEAFRNPSAAGLSDVKLMVRGSSLGSRTMRSAPMVAAFVWNSREAVVSWDEAKTDAEVKTHLHILNLNLIILNIIGSA